MSVGEYVCIHRRVPVWGGRRVKLHKLGKKTVQVLLRGGAILELRKENVK